MTDFFTKNRVKTALWVGLLLMAMACLIGVCMAEPQPVDGGWHRSDELPRETPTAASADADPVNATIESEPKPGDYEPDPIELEAAEQQADRLRLVCVAGGLFALATAGWCLWKRRAKR